MRPARRGEAYGGGAARRRLGELLSAPDPGPSVSSRRCGSAAGGSACSTSNWCRGTNPACIAVVTTGSLSTTPGHCSRSTRSSGSWRPSHRRTCCRSALGHPCRRDQQSRPRLRHPPLIVESVTDGAPPVFQVWVRPTVGVVDELFAPDVRGTSRCRCPTRSGRRGWAPTVQLTALSAWVSPPTGGCGWSARPP